MVKEDVPPPSPPVLNEHNGIVLMGLVGSGGTTKTKKKGEWNYSQLFWRVELGKQGWQTERDSKMKKVLGKRFEMK